MENNKITGNEPATACKSTADSGTLLGEVDIHHTGLTIRQQFAMAAMQGILSDQTNISPNESAYIAEFAVDCADKLIAELNK